MRPSGGGASGCDPLKTLRTPLRDFLQIPHKRQNL